MTCGDAQVWKNAFLFNLPDHVVFKAAKQMASAFEEKLALLHVKLEADIVPCPLLARCQLLLSDIRRNPLSEWFRREQDWRKLGDDYIPALPRRVRSGRCGVEGAPPP